MLYDQIASNKRRTVVLIVAFFILLTIIGAAAGYLLFNSLELGAFLATIIGLICIVSMISQSTNIVMSMNNAREITVEEMPDYYHIVEDMAMVAQIPMPRVFVIEDPALNAFATGSSPENAAVAATTGLLALMNREELEGVMGHEVSHIRNYDIRIATIAVALTSVITMISSMGTRFMYYGGGRRSNRDSDDNSGAGVLVLVLSILALMLAPLAASMVQFAISRQREFLADAGAVELTRNPMGMIKALEKLQGSKPMQNQVDDASAALYINEPRKKKTFSSLFQTHPPIPERIERLRKM